MDIILAFSGPLLFFLGLYMWNEHNEFFLSVLMIIIGIGVLILLITFIVTWLKSNFMDYLLSWRELTIILTFSIYLLIVYIFTQHIFSHKTYKKRKKSIKRLTTNSLFIIRPIIFFLVTTIIWFRSDFLLTAIHVHDSSGLAKILLSIVFGFIFALWPTTGIVSIVYSFILAHIRTFYVIVVVISLILLLLLWLFFISIYILILLSPIIIYLATIFVLMDYNGQSINFQNSTHIIIIIGLITMFIMLIRPTWNLVIYFYSNKDEDTSINHIHILLKLWKNSWDIFSSKYNLILRIFSIFCQRLYRSIYLWSLSVGGYLGSDIQLFKNSS